MQKIVICLRPLVAKHAATLGIVRRVPLYAIETPATSGRWTT